MPAPPRAHRYTAVLLMATMLAAAGFSVLASARMWPLIDGDGPSLFPAVIEWSEGRPLTNPVWPPQQLDEGIDVAGAHRFTYHGFLYPMVVGELARLLGGGPRPSIGAAYIVHLLAAGVSASAILACSSLAPGFQVPMALILVPAMFALSLAWHGRVEPLAMLVVSAAILGWRYAARWRDTLVGATAAVIFFTSPAAGILAMCVAGAALTMSVGGPSRRRFANALAGA